MQRAARLMAMLLSIVPIAALAQPADDAMVVGHDELAAQARTGGLRDALSGLASGDLRFVLLDAATTLPAPEPAPPAADPRSIRTALGARRPPQRPAIVVATQCSDDAAPIQQVRAAFSGTRIWLMQPESACTEDSLSRLLKDAAAVPDRDRISVLVEAGLSFAPPAPEPDPMAASMAQQGGTLVISALPAGTTLTGAPAQVIRASTENVVSAVPGRVMTTRLPRSPGMAEPAVVVGELAGLLAADRRGPMGTPREVRNRIRTLDESFFDRLLQAGIFDPENGQYIAGIQSELAGMSCYSGGIDGQWGSGSQSGLDRYAATRGDDLDASRPGEAMYREIIRAEPVTCPAPRVVRSNPQPAASSGGGGGSRSSGGSTARRSTSSASSGSTPRRQAAPARSQQPRPQQQQQQQQAAPSRSGGSLIDPNLASGFGSGSIQ